MAIVTGFTAGPYTATWNAVAINPTVQGYNLETQHHADEIKQSDIYGDSLLDGVFRGATYTLDFEAMTYTGTYSDNTTTGSANAGAGVVGMYWPWGKFGTISTAANPVGALLSSMAKSLVLTAVANTSASAAPASLTAPYSILSQGSQKLLYSSKLRTVPIKLVLLPQDLGDSRGAFCFTQT